MATVLTMLLMASSTYMFGSAHAQKTWKDWTIIPPSTIKPAPLPAPPPVPAPVQVPLPSANCPCGLDKHLPYTKEAGSYKCGSTFFTKTISTTKTGLWIFKNVPRKFTLSLGRCGFAINGKLCCPTLEKSAPNPEEEDNAYANAYHNCPQNNREVEYDHYKCGNTLLTIRDSDYRHTFKNAPRKFIFNWDAACTMINDEPCYGFPKKPEGASALYCSATATTIKSPSSSSLPIPSFMPAYEHRSMDWMKVSLRKATNFQASGRWRCGLARRSRRPLGWLRYTGGSSRSRLRSLARPRRGSAVSSVGHRALCKAGSRWRRWS